MLTQTDEGVGLMCDTSARLGLLSVVKRRGSKVVSRFGSVRKTRGRVFERPSTLYAPLEGGILGMSV